MHLRFFLYVFLTIFPVVTVSLNLDPKMRDLDADDVVDVSCRPAMVMVS